eukprot:gene24478-29584_t
MEQKYINGLGHGEDPLDLFDISHWNHPDDHMMITNDFSQVTAANPVFRVPSAEMTTETSDATLPRSAQNSQNSIQMRKNVIPTIATIYEPKFFEIFQAYQSFVSIHHSAINNAMASQQHLMTLCLNNLLVFSQWARESDNAQYVRGTLFDNPDMRPEVRNGLALILVYTFSAARAADLRHILGDNPTSNIDMFSVLMKAESGLGIVNKTSLKIYSDPYGYFNFLKACITGLIDALAIPENERINTQSNKKTRRGSRNRDEVEAFDYLRSSLTSMFQSSDNLSLARERIAQIMAFWTTRGKSVRNERFSSIFQLPPPGVHVSSSGMQMNPLFLNMGMASANTHVAAGNPSNNPSGISIALPSSSTTAVAGRLSGNSFRSTSTDSNPPYNTHTPNPQTLQSSQSSYPTHTHAQHTHSASLNVENDSDEEGVESVMSEGNDTPLSQHDVWGRKGVGRFSYPIIDSAAGTSKGNSPQPSIRFPAQPHSSHTPPSYIPFQAQVPTFIPFHAMKFERIGVYVYRGLTSPIFDLDPLLGSGTSAGVCMSTPLYLVDEEALAEHLGPRGDSGMVQVTLTPQLLAIGVNSLEKLLLRAGALVTSWSPADLPQARWFLDSYRNHCLFSSTQQSAHASTLANSSYTFSMGAHPSQTNANTAAAPNASERVRRRTTGTQELKRDLALLQLEHRGSAESAMHNPSSSNNTEASSLPSLLAFWGMVAGGMGMGTGARKGRGVLVYERSSEVGLIVRASAAHNLPYDVWCTYYPDDLPPLLASNGNGSGVVSFAHLLQQLLPQTRVLSNNSNRGTDPPLLAIGYYAHLQTQAQSPSSPLLPPASPPAASAYRTVGTLLSPAYEVLSRLSRDCFFHDIVLL